MTLFRLAHARRLELLDARTTEEGEEPQIADGVAIFRIQPELVELIGLCQFGIEPDRSRFGLADLRSRRRGDERQHDPVGLAPADATNEIHAGGDVAPLIAAAHLQRASELNVEDEKIVGLEKRVAEL